MADPASHPDPRGVPLLALGALGVVFGDIGTNVLFAMPAAFHGPHSVPVGRAEVLGVLSLVFWALVLVLAVKYLGFILRADNRGEGGALALLALLTPVTRPASRLGALLAATGLFGAALVYGDGVITPAISVLAAVEGIAIQEPRFGRLVVPATIAILVALFLVQRRGTGRIGAVFGPIMLVWFLAIGALGLRGIVRQPEVLAAVSPRHALRLLFGHGAIGFPILGAIVLTVAGAEALYADVGHFGVRPIRRGWYAVVFPALLLNYFGQGALLLAGGDVVRSPFYALVPDRLYYPMVGLATAATIIASQALISGAFSLTRQAVQLGVLPRITVRHTSTTIPGRVYVPEVNTALMVVCIVLVLTFRESSRLAAAYGMAVAGAMASTTLLFYFVLRERWRWGAFRAGGLTAAFLLIDLSFVGANLLKIPYGAWIPLVIAGAVYLLMSTWKRGREILARAVRTVSVGEFLRSLEAIRPARVRGTAVFLTPDPERVPPEMIHYLRHSGALHRQVILIRVRTEEVPVIPEAERIELKPLAGGLVQVTARYGFRQSPDLPSVLERCAAAGVAFDPASVTYFLGQITLLRTARPGMARWRKTFFAFVWRNAQPERTHFRIPPGRVVEIGMEIEV